MAGKRAVRIGMVLAVLMFGIAAMGIAQEADPMNFTYGKISKITGNEIGVMVYDFNVHDEVEEVYVADAQTVYDGVESIAGLVVGDDIDIEYVEADGQKTIKNLYKTMVDVGDAADAEMGMAEEAQEAEAVEMMPEVVGNEEIQELDETDMIQDLEDDEMIQNAEVGDVIEGTENVQDVPAVEQNEEMFDSEM